jgi:hypothetical protein
VVARREGHVEQSAPAPTGLSSAKLPSKPALDAARLMGVGRGCLLESAGCLREHPFCTPARARVRARCNGRHGGIDEGRWRHEFLPSENLGSGIHLVTERRTGTG